jgi:hypothetical protein
LGTCARRRRQHQLIGHRCFRQKQDAPEVSDCMRACIHTAPQLASVRCLPHERFQVYNNTALRDLWTKFSSGRVRRKVSALRVKPRMTERCNILRPPSGTSKADIDASQLLQFRMGPGHTWWHCEG